MKILIAHMNHETNTFSPVATPLEAFGRDGPCHGDDAYCENAGMRTAMSAFIDAAKREGAEIVTPISASANPSGRVAGAAYDAICQAIVDAAEVCDAVMLDLHGAMVAEIRPMAKAICSNACGVCCRTRPSRYARSARERHAGIIDNADIVTSFKTHPHVDMYESGDHAARLLLDLVHGKTKPVIA
ncbi:M81 family metallopeptidase [Caballeronia sp. LZ019]|uniref:M81 family metallopeptidase n=1 Tax=Caballeronia sp. LZ019 TaxID=3038555 RepID=UPI002862C0F1|nr:M81 family metallopeptidase [Caballeronia sp. LZ019]MDR5809174.1 M81 family metallopeptidase [Caballeronia sp. LZ019]